jgi:hypothetical protein
LNSCVAEAKEELGEPSFRHKVVVGLPEPFLNQQDWGELNDVKLDFSKREDRITACKWYIDLVCEKFNESSLEHLDLDGFYWVNEQMSTNDFITEDIGDYIRSKGQRFYWIPYYMSNGYSQWKDYGFDIAYLQPNYFFNKKIGEERVRNACELAFTHNMGVEMEFYARALYDSKENQSKLLPLFRQLLFKDKLVSWDRPAGLLPGLHLLYCRLHQRGHFCFSLGDVSHQDPRLGHVHRRTLPVDRYLPDRAAHTLAA